MKNKIIKIFVILVLVISIISMNVPVVHAGFLDNLKQEAGYNPDPPPPPDVPVTPPTNPDPTPTPTPLPTPSDPVPQKPAAIVGRKVTGSQTYYTSISGQILEDTSEKKTENSDETTKIPIKKGVTVEIKNTSNNQKQTVPTSNGTYSVSLELP